MPRLAAEPLQAGPHQDGGDEEAGGVAQEGQPPGEGEQQAAHPRAQELLAGSPDGHQAAVAEGELIGLGHHVRYGPLQGQGVGDVAHGDHHRHQIDHHQAGRTERHGYHQPGQHHSRDEVADDHHPMAVHAIGQ